MKKEEGRQADNSFGVASVVLGIIGLVGSIIILPVVFSITSLVFGILQYKNSKNKWAIWGIAISIIGIIAAIYFFWNYSSTLNSLVDYCNANPSDPNCATILQSLTPAP